MSIILVLGAIAAIIFYIIQLRANKKLDMEEGNDQEFIRDVFEPVEKEHYEERLLLSDPYEDLEKLAKLYDKGILTKDEFESKKKEILERI